MFFLLHKISSLNSSIYCPKYRKQTSMLACFSQNPFHRSSESMRFLSENRVHFIVRITFFSATLYLKWSATEMWYNCCLPWIRTFRLKSSMIKVFGNQWAEVVNTVVALGWIVKWINRLGYENNTNSVWNCVNSLNWGVE